MRILTLTVLLFLILIGPVWGVTRTASTGDWNTAGTWTPVGVPTGNDNVIIPVGVTVTISVDIAVFLLPIGTVNTITINGTLILNNAGIWMRTIDILTINAGGQIVASGLGAFIGSGFTFFTTGNTPFPINGPTTINGGTLPITLLFFEGYPIENGVILNWASATELNFDHYRIEYSTDGEKFELLTKVNGVMNSELRRDYEYIDYSPKFGTNYYRLVSVDLDGYTEYFDVISIYYNNDNKGISIYPNPVTSGEIVSIQPNFNFSPESKIVVRDLQGRPIIDSSFGGNSKTQLSTSQLATGIYLVSFLSNEGISTEKLIVR